MRPRILSDDKVERIREVFATTRKIRERCRTELLELPSVEQLAKESGCSIALVRLVGSGYKYMGESNDLHTAAVEKPS